MLEVAAVIATLGVLRPPPATMWQWGSRRVGRRSSSSSQRQSARRFCYPGREAPESLLLGKEWKNMWQVASFPKICPSFLPGHEVIQLAILLPSSLFGHKIKLLPMRCEWKRCVQLLFLVFIETGSSWAPSLFPFPAAGTWVCWQPH